MEARSIPSVDALLSSPAAEPLRARVPHALVVEAVRHALDAQRERLRRGEPAELSPEAIVTAATRWVEEVAAAAPPRVVNATGVVLHTNLGRAPLAPAAIDALARVAAEPCALELDLVTGERGERDVHVVEHLRALTGAEDALVVNNNAAALLLAVDTLAERREVVVSRGELIEIGGSFRLPDVLRKGGARLVEVGTTNRTRVEDFAAAVTRRTAMILRAHPSNYRIEGFTACPALGDLARLARERGVPLVEDLGSGALVDLAAWGLPHEPTPPESIRAGVDLVTFSGDKLLGGPQAGIAVGRGAIVERMRRNPLRRALRPDKLTLTALAATLALYRTSRDLPAALPALGLLCRPLEALDALAGEATALLRAALPADFALEVVASEAEIGSGAQPTVALPSRAIAVAHRDWPEERVAAWFRAARPPIVGRLTRGRFLLDLRAVGAAADLVPHRAGEPAR